MANTLAEILLKTAECLKGLRYSISTDTGTQTTLIDAAMDEPDGFFDGGTIWFLSGDLAGKTAIITDWDEDTHTFTFASQSIAPGNVIKYAAFDANYRRDALIAAVNSALSALGPLPTITVDATLVTVAAQEEYTLPTGVNNIKRVEIASNLTEPYGYVENTGWFESGGSLWFDLETPATAGYQIRLYHEEAHDRVEEDDDVIDDLLHPDMVSWNAAVIALISRTGISENSEPHTKEMLSYARQQAAILNAKHAVKHWLKASRPSGW